MTRLPDDGSPESSPGSESSSGSERRLTPSSSIRTGSTYSRQHNVTPTPERKQSTILEDFEELQVSNYGASEAGDGVLVSDLAGLEIQTHSSLEFNGDDDDLVYNLRTESLPNAPIYDVKLQDALRDTKAQLCQLHEIMRGCPLLQNTDSNLSELAHKSQELSQFDYPRTRTIGLVGDSGVGKSSLINSLLDENGIARSSGDGGACTNIVTEYRYLSPPKEGNYYFEVDYMSSEEVKIFLEDLISSYRAYNTEIFREIKSQVEREAVKDKAERSAAALNAVFGGCPGYSEDSLLREGQDAAVKILQDLEGMVEGIQQQRPGGLTTSTWSATANTIDDLTSQLDVFIRVQALDGSPVLWPFVSIIRVHLRSLFLRTGLVLADLPGLRDLNYARVRATDRYLRNCHEIFAVARIDRATTDVGIKDIVGRCSQRPLRIVCTHSEAVEAKETEVSSREAAPRIKVLRSAIDSLSKRLKQLEKARRQRTADLPRNCLEDEVNIRDELQQAKFNLQKFLVQRRNVKVQNSLRQQYSAKVMNGDLQVFCVSNKEYSEYRDEEVTMAGPRVELSGIPDLRRYCQLIPAAAQFGAVAAFLEHQVPSHLGSIRQWLILGSDGLTVERADKLRAALECSKGHFIQWTALVSTLSQDLKSDFRIAVLAVIDENTPDWSSQARSKSQEWAGWHHSTYSAFCRKYGEHSTTAVGFHNWNDEIVSAMRDDLDPDWTGLNQQARQRINDTVKSISTMFDDEEHALSSCIELAPNAIGNLLTNMKPKMNCIEDLVETAMEDFVWHLQDLQNTALNGHPSSYVAGLMHPAYVACQSESGTGSDAHRKGHIRHHLSGTTVFNDLRRNIRSGQWKAIESVIDAIKKGLQAEFDSLLLDIKSVVCEEGEVSESRRYPETASQMQSLVDTLTQALQHRHLIISRLRE